MGSRLARDEAVPDIPTWVLEEVLEQGTWDPSTTITGWRGPTTRVERVLIGEVVKGRRMAEVLRSQLDAMEGLG